MNWKKFLKPDWRKIVITIILFSIIFFVPTPQIVMASRVGPLVSWRSIYQYDMESIICCLRPYTLVIEKLFYQLTSIIIISYLLSCFIVWIYDKVKKK